MQELGILGIKDMRIGDSGMFSILFRGFRRSGVLAYLGCIFPRADYAQTNIVSYCYAGI
jgi:hypothetical protein